jgi:hypothetical protein
VMTLVDLLSGYGGQYAWGSFPQDAKVVAFLDSPYYIDIVPFTLKFPGFQYEEQQKFNFINTTGVIPRYLYFVQLSHR